MAEAPDARSGHEEEYADDLFSAQETDLERESEGGSQPEPERAQVNPSSGLSVESGPNRSAVSRGALPLFLFTLALAGGIYLIAENIFQPWSPAGVVLAYAIILFAGRRNFPLTGEIKDSAYYLGFSLNLIFLLVAFRNYGPKADVDQGAVQYLIRSLGSAITATIAGLIARYALYIADDDELVQRKVFLELQDEVRRSVLGFRRSQHLLVQGVSDFLRVRQALAKEETVASEQYLANLRKLLQTIQLLNSTEVEAVAKSVRTLEPATELSLRQLRHINDEFGKLKQSLVLAELDKAFASMKASLGGAESSVSGTASAFEALVRSLSESRKRIADMAVAAPKIAEDLAAVDAILTDFIAVLRQRVNPPR